MQEWAFIRGISAYAISTKILCAGAGPYFHTEVKERSSFKPAHRQEVMNETCLHIWAV